AFRLARAGCGVEALPIPMVALLSPDRLLVGPARLRSEILPLDRSWLGFGQMVVSQIRHRSFLHFLFLHPWPLLLWSALLLYLVDDMTLAARAFALMALYLVVRRGPWETLSLLTEPLRAPFGMIAYRGKAPRIETIKDFAPRAP
ncbi:MAG: hypothetical protein IKO55_05190, partial [Kiritimatiellae bacterium]|nr:hypothetical protein [Kiritimatiellia bacterium]